MEYLYLWIRDYKTLKHIGINLSSKVNFIATVIEEKDDGELEISLTCEEHENYQLFPDCISDVKALIGENGVGKSNILFYLSNFLMNKSNSFINGFLITSTHLIIRDKIKFTHFPDTIFGRKLDRKYNHDIINFHRLPSERQLSLKESEGRRGDNLLETFFNNNYLVFYSNILNQDNYFISEGVENNYALWQNQELNFFDLSTESLIIQDYKNLVNGPGYIISGGSELLAYKHLESLRALDFLAQNIENSLPFKIHGVSVYFNDSEFRFWESLGQLISNSTRTNSFIDRITAQDLAFEAKDIKNAFLNELSSHLLYCILSFQLKDYYNFSPEGNIPLVQVSNDFEQYYDIQLDHFSALYKYIQNASNLRDFQEKIIEQIEIIRRFFEHKFDDKTFKSKGIHGFYIPEENVKSVIHQFIEPPFYGLKLKNEEREEIIRLNFWGFDFQGLSSGERSMLSIFSRFYYIKKHIVKKNAPILCLIDEGEIGFHPQWQKMYLKTLLDFIQQSFIEYKFQIIITSHSPFLVSDLPNQNIVFLEKIDETTSISKMADREMTFGANIHSLFTDAFFLQGAIMGDFAKSKIDELIERINKGELSEGEIPRFRHVLEMIGEPVLKYKIEELWIDKLGKDEEIRFLENRLKQLRGKN